MEGALGDAMTGYPIQPAKVQVPSLREQTLERDRLLDWLAAKIHHRVILVVADAGYGKTTLLADFSRRTRLRMLWYRLDDDDRDWMSFLSHLIAAGREHDPGFAPRSAAMLSDLALGGPTREAATESFLRELPSIARQGAVLVLDDFHLVEDSPDVRQIVRDIVSRGPERLSIAFASRRVPSVPLAKLRASGEVAELGTDDLRFDAKETARLFSETYGRPLEPDVLADVAARTEGWAASLHLVQAALRDRPPAEIRRFVRSLSGADRELYDYLAEEVVGDLPDDLQQFLMRTSILQIVTPELASVVTGLDDAEVSRLTTDAERLTLLTRRSRSTRGPQRYHPLVREFLEARLRAVEGEPAVAAHHRRVGENVGSHEWDLAAHHFREAGEPASVARVLEEALPEIMSKGAYEVAGEFISGLPVEVTRPGFGVVTSRLRMQAGDYEGAISAAQLVLRQRIARSDRDLALLNLVTVHLNAGDIDQSVSLAETLAKQTTDANLKLIAEAVRLSVAASAAGGDLDHLSAHFRSMADLQRGSNPHHFGVTMLNLAQISTLQDDPRRALIEQAAALEAFEATSASIERSSTLAGQCAALAQLGRLTDADDLLTTALERTDLRTEGDLVLEAAEFHDSYGDPDRARGLFEEANAAPALNKRHLWVRSFTMARHEIRLGRYSEARRRLDDFPSLASTNPGGGTARRVVVAHLAAAAGQQGARALAYDAQQIAHEQRAYRWRRLAELLVAYCGAAEELSDAVGSIGKQFPWHLTFLSHLLSHRLGDLSSESLDAVRAATALHPRRWQHSLRAAVDAAHGDSSLAAGRLLEGIGDRTDVRRLRGLARSMRRAPGAAELGRGLARRLAPKVLVNDLGRISITVGDSAVPGTKVRRRVLALLTFVLTRQGFSCTREQVLDAMWPDLEPALAMNSLNQTVYFLRRVFEEDFSDDLSPGYLHHDAEVLWLDAGLVSSQSATCSRMIRDLTADPRPDQVEALSLAYTARFALDFEYEDWAQDFRDWLHACYLQIAERAVVTDLSSGHFDRGIRIARRALQVDPGADSVEVALLKLYTASGAHAAAAEQYAHYSERLRNDLDVEAPPLESL